MFIAACSGPGISSQQKPLKPSACMHRSTGLVARISTIIAHRTRTTPPPASMTSSAVAAAADASSQPPPTDTVLQYVILRKDLWTELDWPLGSIVAQACHASTAALWLSKDSETTQGYCSPGNIDHMHKVVLEAKDESQLRSLSEKMAEAGVQHKLWIEQPEDFPTCLATAPYPKSVVAPLVKKLKLCKGV